MYKNNTSSIAMKPKAAPRNSIGTEKEENILIKI